MAQTGIKSAYNCLKQKLNITEPLNDMYLVDAYREYWHPAYPNWCKTNSLLPYGKEENFPSGKVKVLLFAESHVLNGPAISRPLPKLVPPLINPPMPWSGYPQEYVRFVYNLGYGESHLYSQPPVPNRGTWQYWRIFAACSKGNVTGTWPGISKSRTRNNINRISNKIKLLKELQARGIWLLDTSVAGKPAGLGAREYIEFIKCSWCNSTRARILQEKPDFIIIIGGMVAGALLSINCIPDAQKYQTHVLEGIPTAVIHQPQARLRSGEIADEYQTIHDICAKYAP